MRTSIINRNRILPKSDTGTGLLATASSDETARVWDLAGGPAWRNIHDGEVVAVAFRPDGRLLATGSSDGTARAWTDLGPSGRVPGVTPALGDACPSAAPRAGPGVTSPPT